MQQPHYWLAERTGFLTHVSDLAAGCDHDFDFHHTELEREFAELRLTFGKDE